MDKEYCKNCGVLLTEWPESVIQPPALTTKCRDIHEGGYGDIVCWYCLDHRVYPVKKVNPHALGDRYVCFYRTD